MKHLKEESCRGSMRPEQSLGAGDTVTGDLENCRGTHEMYTVEDRSKDLGAASSGNVSTL